MGSFVKGDIIVVNFPFTNASVVKKRPALIIKKRDNENYIMCPITSSNRRGQYGFEIDNNDFDTGTLDRKSYIEYDFLATIHDSLINKKIAKLRNDRLTDLVKKVVSFISS